MLSGLTFGEAIAAARWQTWNDHPAVNTWGAYQCYGDPDYRLAPDAVVHRATTVRRAPASAEQARVEIENLSQSVDVSRNTRFGLDRLRELYEALVARGPRGRRAPGAHRPDVQQVRRLRPRHAVLRADPRAGRDGPDRARLRGLDRPGGPGGGASEDAVDDAVATIESAIDRLRTLLDNPASLVLGQHAPERAAFLPGDAHEPSGWRRHRPALAGRERLQAARPRHVSRPARLDAGGRLDADARRPDEDVRVVRRGAHRVGRHRPASARRPRQLARCRAGPALAAGRGSRRSSTGPRRDGSSASRSAAAREEAYLAPTFWTVTVYADLLVLDALWSPRATADEAQEALDLYRRASELGSEEQLRQVRDQVDFLIVMAGTEAQRRVEFLQTLRDGLVALDAPTDRHGRHGGHGHRLTAYLAYVAPAGETAVIEQLEVEAYAVRQAPRAAAHDDGHRQQPQLVDDAGSQGLGREGGPADADVAVGRGDEPGDGGRGRSRARAWCARSSRPRACGSRRPCRRPARCGRSRARRRRRGRRSGAVSQ